MLRRALLAAPLATLFAALFVTCSANGPSHEAGAATGAGAARWQSPPTRAGDVVDDYHGTQVADPYRWLEDQDGAEVAAWVRAQNAATRAVLDAIPERAAIEARLRELWNHERWSAPQRAGGRWFWLHNDGLQDQSVLFVGDAPDAPGRVLLDPNTLSADGTVALGGLAIDEQGERIAYAISERGSDWRTWRVRDVATGQDLPDTVPWSKFAGAAWTHDGAGFFYQAYPPPAEGATYEAANLQPQLRYHAIGGAGAAARAADGAGADRVVYERPDHPEWSFAPQVTDDGRFLIVRIGAGSDRRNRVAFVDLQGSDLAVQPLLMDFDAAYDFVGNDGDTFFFRTDRDAPSGRVIAVDRTQPDKDHWREVVPARENALRSVRLVGGTFVCSYLADAASEVLLVGLDGAPQGAIPLPTLGTASGFTGEATDTATFFTFATFTAPPAIWRYDFATKACTAVHVPHVPDAPADLVTQRVFPQSADGTRLCLFLVHKKGLRLDGSTPCLLYGYGGFDIAMTPRFAVPNLVFVERGGVFAQAVLRGGGEYGSDWHHAGMLGSKQNVFDDFLACADYLVRNRYTQTQRLAVTGGSNGGLLVGAVLTQHPERFGAAVPHVGVMDMLRYHRFTIGHAWAAEYGRSDDPEAFEWLYHYSPLHNVKDAVYPPTLILTGDHDDRVLPGHSYKFAATLQQAQQGPAPILLRVETDTGHGAGKPTHKQIAEAADELAFLEFALRGAE